MTLKRLDNVEIIVEDLDAVIAFFTELGMELEGKAVVEGVWAARLVGLDDQKVDIAMLKTPDGSGRVELAQYHTPDAIPSLPKNAAPNTLGIRRIMFGVDGIDDTIARMRAGGAELVGDVVEYGGYRMCYLRGPEGILVALAEELGLEPVAGSKGCRLRRRAVAVARRRGWPPLGHLSPGHGLSVCGRVRQTAAPWPVPAVEVNGLRRAGFPARSAGVREGGGVDSGGAGCRSRRCAYPPACADGAKNLLRRVDLAVSSRVEGMKGRVPCSPCDAMRSL